MGTIREILRQKQGQPLRVAHPDETVLQATKRMNEFGIGAPLVMDGTQLVGIFTERDVLRRVVAEERQPAAVRVAEVMTTNIACATADTTIDDARNIMKQRRIRHLPIVNARGEAEGLISIGDLNAYDATNHEVTIHYLQEYLHGRV
jgi:CBS domain-containing protein